MQSACFTERERITLLRDDSVLHYVWRIQAKVEEAHHKPLRPCVCNYIIVQCLRSGDVALLTYHVTSRFPSLGQLQPMVH